jgi:hypothetical protein
MRRNQSGATIIVVISIIAFLAVLVGGALDYTFTVGRNVERANKMTEATAIANGCLNYEYMYWREYCRTNTNPGPPTNSFSGIPLPTSTQFPNVSNFTATTGSSSSYIVSNYYVKALTPQLSPLSGSTSPSAGVAASSTNRTYFYEGNATVTLPDRGPPVTVTATQIFEQQYQNPWEWAIFFNDPLEIEPGNAMTVDGWVQTNSALYTPLNTLTFGSKVTYGTTWNISAMPGDEHLINDGDTYADPNWPSGEPPAQGTPSQPFGLNASDIFTNTTGNNNTSYCYHELIEPPVPSSPDPLSGQRYYDAAGVKVLINSSGVYNTATVYDNSGSTSYSNGVTSMGNIIGTITYKSSTSHTTTSAASGDSTYQTNLFNTVASAVSLYQSNNSSQYQTIQDDREGQTIPVTEVNIATLTSAMSSGGTLYNSGFNGVVYIDDETDQNSTATGERAVELVNGASLPATGLTVASGDPVYIEGDYNTGSNPPSDSGNYSDPTTSGYTMAPASVVGDAVTFLSNSWSNKDSTNSLSSRQASNTTINTAIMSGIVPTSGGNYSGGAENFPRFLEDWSSSSITYYGSMVELYDSNQATGIWGQSNVYGVPNVRAWHYNTNFQVNPPPGTIMVVSYLKGQWYYQ